MRRRASWGGLCRQAEAPGGGAGASCEEMSSPRVAGANTQGSGIDANARDAQVANALGSYRNNYIGPPLQTSQWLRRVGHPKEDLRCPYCFGF
jgi:hypothetical protein